MPQTVHSTAIVSASIMMLVSTLALPAFARGEGCVGFLGFCLPPHQEQNLGDTATDGDEDEVVARVTQSMDRELPIDDPIAPGIDPVLDGDELVGPNLVPYETGRGVVLVPASYFGRELSIEEQFEFGNLVQELLDAQNPRSFGPGPLLPQQLTVAPELIAVIPDATPVGTANATTNTNDVASAPVDEQQMTNEEQPAADMETATTTDPTL